MCVGVVYMQDVKDTPPHTALQLLHHHHVLLRELRACRLILLECVIVRFKHRPTKQL
jgi:hypothetical protein